MSSIIETLEMWGEFKRTKITVLICYSLDLECIPRTRMLKMLSGHWGMVGTYRGEVSWEEARSWVLLEKSGVYVPPGPLDVWPPWCEQPVAPCAP